MLCPFSRRTWSGQSRASSCSSSPPPPIFRLSLASSTLLLHPTLLVPTDSTAWQVVTTDPEAEAAEGAASRSPSSVAQGQTQGCKGGAGGRSSRGEGLTEGDEEGEEEEDELDWPAFLCLRRGSG